MTQEKKLSSRKAAAGSRRKTTQKTNDIDALRESEAKYRGFIENLPVMFYAVEPQPPYAPLYVSPAFARLGHPLEEWRENSDLWTRVLHPDDRDWVLEKTEAAMRAGTEIDYEYRIVAKNGDVHWVRDRGSFVRDAKGSVICWQGIILDITQNKLAGQKLQKSEKLYRTLVHSVPRTAVVLFDRDFRYTLADGNLLKTHGFTRETFEGKTLWEVFPPATSDEWADYYRRALAGETISLERESAEGWFQIYVVPIKNECGEIFSGMVMWQNVTVQKFSEKALRDSEQRYRALTERSLGLICTHDLEGKLLSVNPAAAKSFGYAAEELVGQPLQSLVPPDASPLFGRYLDQIVTDGEFFGSFRILTKSGEERILRVSNTLYEENGKPAFVLGNAQDITTLKRAEREMRALFEAMTDVIIVLDKDGRFLKIAPTNSSMLSRDPKELIGKTVEEIYRPEQASMFLNFLRTAFATKETQTLDYMLRVGGRAVWLTATLSVMTDETALVVVRDITERRVAKEALRESEARYRDLFENASDLIYIRDLQGNYQSINKATERVFGYTPEEAVTMNIRQIVAPEHLERARQMALEEIAGTRRSAYEIDCLTKNGARITLEVNSSVIYKNGAAVGVQGVARDVTERKRTEQILKEREEEYRDLFENANDLIYTHDLRGNYLSINKVTERVLGYSSEEASKMNLRQIIVPEHQRRVRRMLADRVAGTRRSTYEVDCLTRNGRRVTLEVSSRTIRKDGKAVAVQGIARDITERKRTEAALKKSEEQYRELFENANDLIYTRDLAGNFKSLNRAGEIITGYTREEALKLNFNDLIVPEYRERAREVREQLRAGASSVEHELEIFSKQGRRITLELSTRIILQNGQPVGVQGIARDITERKRAEKALQINEAKLKDLFDNAPVGYHELDREGRIVRVNRTELEMFGYTTEEMIGRCVWEFTVDKSASRASVMKKLSGVEPSEPFERVFRRKDGSLIPVLIEERLIRDGGGTVTGIRTTVQDITERKLSEKALVNSERRYRSLGEGIMHQVWTAQPNGKIDYVNGRTLEYSGQRFEQLTGDRWQDVIHPDDLPPTLERWSRSLVTGEDYETQFRLKKHDGEYRWHQARATAGRDADGRIVNWFGTNSDINDQKIAEAKLNHIAGHDTLTNLPNRAKFMTHLTRAADRAVHDPARRFAVLFLDLDRFKVVNDSLGHTVGDKLLVAFAKRLEECVRPNDVVARLGGDEFTVLLSHIQEPEDAARVASRFLEKLSAPFKLDAYEVFTSASIGIILSDETHRAPDDLLRDADTAMYRAKESGKSRFEIFDREMHIRNMKLLQIETDLRRAIEQNEFKVFYQPLVELETGEIREFEALIRWQHPLHGLVPPNDFIGIAEETGLIIPIGRWILEEACRQTAEWQKRFAAHKNLSISVNLSAKQLMHPNLMAQVGEILKTTALNPRRLKLEVTESMVMENSDAALSVISELNKLGIRLSTDDFGTGYSSLSYLHRFPFNRLKIDRSFVSKMDDDPKSEAIVRTILLLARNLNIETVAEGIETESQLASLRQLGCKIGQGYLFAKPVNAETAAQLLENGLQNENVASFYEFGKAGDHQLLELDKVQ